jgi:hypothetical protein
MKVFALRSLTGERAGAIYSVAVVDREAGCTCPDAETNGAVCKHVMALRAVGLLSVVARTASESKAEAARLAANRRRRAAAPPAAVVATPDEQPARLARARRRHSPVTAAPPRTLTPPASPFVAGWKTAVSQHVTQLQGSQA